MPFSRRRLLLLTLFVLVAAVVLIGLESQCLVTGWLRGEAFYNGRPTSYWKLDCERWMATDMMSSAPAGPNGRIEINLSLAWKREAGIIDRIWHRHWHARYIVEPPPLLN